MPIANLIISCLESSHNHLLENYSEQNPTVSPRFLSPYTHSSPCFPFVAKTQRKMTAMEAEGYQLLWINQSITKKKKNNKNPHQETNPPPPKNPILP